MSAQTGPSVLVLDADMVPALTIARSLARRDCQVWVASHTERPIAGYSRAVAGCERYPDPLHAPEQFVDWLRAHAGGGRYDLIVPVTERTVVPLSARRQRLTDLRLALPDADSLELVLDKSRTLELARQLDIPVPSGIAVDSPEQLSRCEASLRYPVVIKPVRSIGASEAGASQLKVSYAFDVNGLRAACIHALRFGAIVLQEYFRGEGVGVELIARRGEIVYAFQHRRLHEVPLTGGGSTLRSSEALHPELLEASRRLIAGLRWHGVAMVEFKQDAASGRFCLMEINGRFWGSLPLAAAAGADFPSMLLDLELTGKVAPVAPYREGIYCRLLSRDLKWYEAVLRRDSDARIVEWPSRRQVLGSLALLFSPRHRFDVQSLRDPLPGIVDLRRTLAGYCQRLSGLLAERRFLRQQGQAWRRGRVERLLAGVDSILLLCHGNINRSLLAEAMLSGYAEDMGVQVQSAGFHPRSGRCGDPVMAEIAAADGVDLSGLRSTAVTADMLQEAAIIFVMEKRHYDRVREMCPGVGDRVFLLGAHEGHSGDSAEIPDPYGQAREKYQQSYQRIAEGVGSIIASLALRSDD